MLLFGAFELDAESYQLRRGGEAIAVEPQVIDVIAYLARNQERLIRKEELLDEVWGSRFVSESALTSRVKSARQALGDDGKTQSMIRTVHGRGYQFVPLVTDSDALPTAAPTDTGTAAPGVGGDLASARVAASAARWRDAHGEFSTLGIGALDAPDLELWGEAAWWDSDIVEAIAIRQEAFRRYLNDGAPCDAARVAIALAENYLHRGSSTVATAWLERADDLLSHAPGCRETGQLLRFRTTVQLELESDPEGALETNGQLRALVTSIGDPDLVAQALQDHGRILLAMGDVEEGMAKIDRSMLVAATTETSPGVRGRMYCNMLSACVGLGHFKRAQDWTDEAITWCADHADSPFPGVCAVHRAGLRRRRGELQQALEDLEALAASSQMSNIIGPALVEIGEIRLARGEVDAAEQAFLRAHAMGAATSVAFARVAVEQGRASDAVALLVEALSVRRDDVLARHGLLPHVVDAATLAGDLETARAAAVELDGLAAGAGDVHRAVALKAVGTVALAAGLFDEACTTLRSAMKIYQEAALPFDLAATQLGVAAASLALGSAPTARLERAAAMAFCDDAGVVPTGVARVWAERLVALD